MRTEWLIHSQVEHVLAALMPANALVLRVALHTGLRVGDVLQLKTADLAPRMWVLEAKTRKRKQVGIPEELLGKIRAQAGAEWVFPSPKDPRKHRTRQAIWWDVKRAARAFRLPQNVAPHSMRKVYAVDLMRRYGNIEKVRRALNHSSTAVTMIYIMADKLMMEKYGDKLHATADKHLTYDRAQSKIGGGRTKVRKER